MEEAFEQCAMGMFGYMTDTETVEPIDTVEVESEGESLSQDFNRLQLYLLSTCLSLAVCRADQLKSVCMFLFLKGEDMESLLFHFLDDWLYKFSADLFFIPRVSILVTCVLLNMYFKLIYIDCISVFVCKSI